MTTLKLQSYSSSSDISLLESMLLKLVNQSMSRLFQMLTTIAITVINRKSTGVKKQYKEKTYLFNNPKDQHVFNQIYQNRALSFARNIMRDLFLKQKISLFSENTQIDRSKLIWYHCIQALDQNSNDCCAGDEDFQQLFQKLEMEPQPKELAKAESALACAEGTPGQHNNSSGDTFIAKEAPEQQEIVTFAAVKKTVNFVLSNLKYQLLISILTIYSLFFDDFRTALFEANVDIYYDILGLVIMSIFTLEILLSSIFLDGYFLSFFFFLDIISTASIIFDVNFLSDMIFETTNTSSLTQLAAQSKASRAATRAVRIVKLVRIIRIIKLYKNAEKAKEIKEKQKRRQILKEKMMRKHRLNESNTRDHYSSNNQYSVNNMASSQVKRQSHQVYPEEQLDSHLRPNQTSSSGHHATNNFPQNTVNTVPQPTISSVPQQSTGVSISDQQLQAALNKESKIGRILSELSIKKIIIVILTLMFIVPLFNIDVYRDQENTWDSTLRTQMELLMSSPSTFPTSTISSLINQTITNFLSQENYVIQYTSPFNELPTYNFVDLSQLRSSDLISSVQAIDVPSMMALRPELTLRTGMKAKESNSLTVILDQQKLNRTLAAFSLAKTLFVCLVLIMLMHMFSKDINQLLVEPIQNMMAKLMAMAKDPESAAKEELSTDIELQTTVISNAIIKIGALLSIVFGSAGAEIIGSNIVEEGDMNPMIEGRKKAAIFGFCDIRHFTEVTEVLQEEILIFVNKIGSLVHESVYRYGGSANKNIGEAFLLVWKIPEQKYALDLQTNAIDWKDRRYLSVLSDFAVLGFVKTLIKIHKDPLVLEYGLDSRLRAAMPDFSVSMGFGLHVGWAIEGAIGSEYKIDASYLSPNVNMASRLEAATKQFGVDFLISQDLYDLLTADMKNYFRNIDRVTVKGSEKPIKLYTIDLAYQRLTPPARNKDTTEMVDSEHKRALNLEYLKEEEIDHYNAKKFIMGKKELKQVLHHNLPEDFKKRFELGVNCYLKGKWGDARLHLCEALKHRLNDGPSKTLLNYMKKTNFVAPNNWKQYRPLTSK